MTSELELPELETPDLQEMAYLLDYLPDLETPGESD